MNLKEEACGAANEGNITALRSAVAIY